MTNQISAKSARKIRIFRALLHIKGYV